MNVESTDTGALLQALSANIVRRAETHPLTTVAGAAGVGIVLARGLPRFALRIASTIAMRSASAQLFSQAQEWMHDRGHREAEGVGKRKRRFQGGA